MYPCAEKLKGTTPDKLISEIYDKLYEHFGPQNWWPAETPFETAVGAILTQSVNWKNVEVAIDNLKKEGLLEPSKILKLETDRLAELIRPSGYFNVKARKLKAFTRFLQDRHNGSIAEMSRLPLEQIRPSLLEVFGIGPETADSILLYAGNYPIFVIDAYTRRIFSRLGLVMPDIDYHELQKFIMDNFKPSVAKYNEYHALLVALGKNICKKRKAECSICPLR
jgi:endonuclease-3 related protein